MPCRAGSGSRAVPGAREEGTAGAAAPHRRTWMGGVPFEPRLSAAPAGPSCGPSALDAARRSATPAPPATNNRRGTVAAVRSPGVVAHPRVRVFELAGRGRRLRVPLLDRPHRRRRAGRARRRRARALRERGYPMDDFQQRHADLSVDCSRAPTRGGAEGRSGRRPVKRGSARERPRRERRSTVRRIATIKG